MSLIHKKQVYVFLLILFLIVSSSLSVLASDSDTISNKWTLSIKCNRSFAHYLDFYQYNIMGMYPYHYSSTYTFENRYLSLFFRRNNSHFAHEIEVDQNINFNSYAHDFKAQGEGVRYKLYYFILKNQTSLLLPYISTSIATDFSKISYQSQDYDTKLFYRSAQWSIIPGFQLNIGKRMFIDLSLPITIFRYSKIIRNEYNNIYKSSFSYSDWLSTFQKSYFQIVGGLGIKLNANKNIAYTERVIKTIKFLFDINSTPFHTFSSSSVPVMILTFQNRDFVRLMHEIQLETFQFNKDKAPNDLSKRIGTSFGYQLNCFLLNKESPLINPYMGLLLSLYYSHSHSTYYTFKQSSDFFEENNFIVPGVQLNTRGPIYFNLSVPYNFSKSGISISRGSYSNNQSTYTFFFPKNYGISLWVEIGIKL